jgi:hypothetical protein
VFLAILRDPDAVIARLRTPSPEWVEACTGEAGTLFPTINIDQAGYEGKGRAVGWVAEPAEIFTGWYFYEDEEIPDSCECIGVYGEDHHMMEMSTGEISIYDPGGWDNANGMASSHEFTTTAHAGAAIALLAAIVKELEPLDDLEDEDARDESMKAALGEVNAFVEALPPNLGGSHFWKKATEGLACQYD